MFTGSRREIPQHTATLCNTLRHTATHCNTLQHTATHCSSLLHSAAHCSALQHTATHCNTLQHTAAHCSTLQHTAAHCNTLQHTATPYMHTRYCVTEIAKFSRKREKKNQKKGNLCCGVLHSKTPPRLIHTHNSVLQT